jgi:WD40 repeat protein
MEPLGEHRSSVEAVAWSPGEHEELLASCGLDKAIRVWDVAARKQLWKNDTEHGYLVRTVAFSPEGSTLASASWDKTMRLWDLTTREPREMPRDDDWETHTDWIWAVAFSLDGIVLASAGSDSKVIVWGLPDDPARST